MKKPLFLMPTTMKETEQAFHDVGWMKARMTRYIRDGNQGYARFLLSVADDKKESERYVYLAFHALAHIETLETVVGLSKRTTQSTTQPKNKPSRRRAK